MVKKEFVGLRPKMHSHLKDDEKVKKRQNVLKIIFYYKMMMMQSY